MSDSMPMLANTGAQTTADAAAGAAVNRQTDTPADANGFNSLFQSYMKTDAESANPNNPLSLLLAEGEALPVFATTELAEGNSLPHEQSPQQPLVQWSALMLWDDSAANGTMPELAVQEKGSSANSAILNYSALQQPYLSQQTVGEAASDVQNLMQSKQLELQVIQNMPAKPASATEATSIENISLPNSDSGVSYNNSQQGLLSGGSVTQLSAQKADSLGLTMNVPPQHPNWGQALGERVQWMVGQNIQQAEVRLDPPELGTIEVRIQMNKEQANVTFSAANAQVRDAVESASARLREMFGEVGLSLGDVNVSQESFAQQQEAHEHQTHQLAGVTTAQGADEEQAMAHETSTVRHAAGLLDTYA